MGDEGDGGGARHLEWAMWIKIGDETHEEMEELSRDAKLLHIGGLYRCGERLTDGYMSPASVRAAASWADVPVEAASELVAAGLWDDRGDGAYYILTYLRDNPSRAEKENKSAIRAEAGRAGGVRSGESRRANGEAKTKQIASQNGKQFANQNAEQNAKPVSRSPYPVPRAPLPVAREKSEAGGEERARSLPPARTAHSHSREDPPPAHRVVAPARDEVPPATPRRTGRQRPPEPTPIPPDFALTDEMRDWAAEHAPDADVDRETVRFVGKAKEQGKTSRDWRASWESWMTSPYATARPDPSPPPVAPRSPPLLLDDQPVSPRMARGIAALRASK